MKKIFLFISVLSLCSVCPAAIITVDDNAPADYNNIQAAINDANNGDTIIVWPGTYTGSGNRDIDFLGKAIVVRSVAPEDPCTVSSTIINCQAHGRGFYFHSGEDANSIVTGLTINGGHPAAEYEQYGGGILCDGASPTISYCLIQGNYAGDYWADAFGGGICCQNNASPVISNCIITDNGASGGGYSACGGGLAARYDSHPVVTNCSITNNSADGEGGMFLLTDAYGGGVYCEGAIDIYNSIVTGNRALGAGMMCGERYDDIISGDGFGGGIYISGWQDVNVIFAVIANCQVAFNQARGGYSMWWTPLPPGFDPPFLQRCSVGASAGGGIWAYNYQGDPNLIIIRNCTIAGNNATNISELYTGSGGGVYGWSSVSNCIIYSNMAYSQVEGAYVTYSDVEGGYFGTGNIYADPLFADVDANDFHLKSQAGRWDPNTQSWVKDSVTSPCIDAGDPNSDWTSEPWPNGQRINMGAYGGTPQASMSLPMSCSVADLDNDCDVDFNDLRLFTGQWLEQGVLLPADLDKDGDVDFVDFAVFSNEWLNENSEP